MNHTSQANARALALAGITMAAGSWLPHRHPNDSTPRGPAPRSTGGAKNPAGTKLAKKFLKAQKRAQKKAQP